MVEEILVGKHVFVVADHEKFDAAEWLRTSSHTNGWARASKRMVYTAPPERRNTYREWMRMADSPTGDFEAMSARVKAAVVAFAPHVLFVEGVFSERVRGGEDGIPGRVGECRVTYKAPVDVSNREARTKRTMPLVQYGGEPLRLEEHEGGIEMIRKMVKHVQPDVVFDPCCGKGAALRAAHEAGAQFIGVDVNPKRIQVCLDWLALQPF